MKDRLNRILEHFNISLRQLFVMYICIFCLPLILTLVLTSRSIGALEEQIHKTAQTMNRQVQAVVDSRMHDIEMLLDQLNNHATIRYLLNRGDPLSSADRYRAATVISDLRRQYANTSMIEDVFIYMEQSDSVLSTFSRADSRFFFTITIILILECPMRIGSMNICWVTTI